MSRTDPFREGDAAARARRRRSLAIALGLVAFILIVFGTTMIRMRQNTQDSREDAAPVRSGGAAAPVRSTGGG